MEKMECYGKSHGKYMSFGQHVDNYPDKEELAQYRRLQEISALMSSSTPGGSAIAMKQMKDEFGSVERAVTLFEDLKTKIFKGWEPID